MISSQGAEARTQPRVRVVWRAQMIAGGRAVEARTTDISESGIGLKVQEQVPAGQTAQVTLLVPDPKGGPGQVVSGTIRVAFSVLAQDGVRAGGTWIELPQPARTLLNGIIRQHLLRIG